MMKNLYDIEQIGNEERDFLLWRYFHKDMTAQESTWVQALLEKNVDWYKAFQEMQQEELQLAGSLETETPSLRFSKNVMEVVAQNPIAKATQSHVNPKLIKSMILGFIATIVYFIIYALSQVQWSVTVEKKHERPFHLPKVPINWDSINSVGWQYGCFAIIIVCVFVLIDRFLYSKHQYNES